MEGVNHLAISADSRDFSRKLENIKRVINLQVKHEIPIMTILVSKKNELNEEQARLLSSFFLSMVKWKLIHENKFKVNVFGKWYDISTDLVDSIKKVYDETKDYDHFFLNLCVNYDGKDEIHDACRLIAKRVKLEKLDPELITNETIKENIYLSSFLPPNIILKYGDNRIPCLLAWDSEFAELRFMNKFFDDFEDNDLQ